MDLRPDRSLELMPDGDLRQRIAHLQVDVEYLRAELERHRRELESRGFEVPVQVRRCSLDRVLSRG